MPIHILDDALHFAQPFLNIVALSAWLIAMVTLFRDRRRVRALGIRQKLSLRYVLALATFIAVIMLEFFLSARIEDAALAEVLPVLESHVLSLTVAGKPFAHPEELLKALRAISTPLAHHSHPEHPIAIVIKSERGELTLSAARDSGVKDEYWVFYPGFHTTELNAIGHIFTRELDSY